MDALRRGVRWARAWAFSSMGRAVKAQARLDGTRAVVIMYHRVMPRSQAEARRVEPGMYISPETFSHHLDWLEESARILPLHEVVSRIAEERSLPAGACALSFDDGWRDNYTNALPELERRGHPATIFVVSERVGTLGAFWPDEVCCRMATLSATEQRSLLSRFGASRSGDRTEALLSRLKQLGEEERPLALELVRAMTPAPPKEERELLDWNELERLSDAGIDIESHGATHEILSTASDETVERELVTARDRLREHGHGRHGLLAYPSGGFNSRVRSIAARLGYRAAFTTELGYAGHDRDLMALPRVGLHDDVSRTRLEFRHRLLGPGHTTAASR